MEIFDQTLYDFEKLVYNTNRVLSSDEIYITKKNKKGLSKTTDIKPSIKSYRFEDNCLFIVLAGQNFENGLQSVRADTLMNAIAEGVMFNTYKVL